MVNQGQMSSLCLFYNIEVFPNDKDSGVVKDTIDMYQLKNNPLIIKNDDIFRVYEKYLPFIDYSKMTRYYMKYSQDGYTIEVIFIEIDNIHYITRESIREYVDIMDRHIKYENNLTNPYWYNYILSKIIESLSPDRTYDIRPLSIGLDSLKHKLYDYQLDNVHWMSSVERTNRQDYYFRITSDRLLHLPDERVYNYTQNKFIRNDEIKPIEFKGAIIADEMGIGKTLEVLAYILTDLSVKTLIVVPNHLVSHWNNEISKHYSMDMIKEIKRQETITVMSFDEYEKKSSFSSYERLIVDELHETYSKMENRNLFNKLVLFPCRFKWGITGTPFSCNYSLFYIIKYLTGRSDFNNYLMERMRKYVPFYQKLFRKNTISQVQKFIHLPEMRVTNHILTFLDTERIIYDAESYGLNNMNREDKIERLRKICVDVIRQYCIDSDRKYIKEDQLYTSVLRSFHKRWDDEVKKEDEYKRIIQELNEKMKVEVHNREHLELNKKHYEELIENQIKNTEVEKSRYDYFNTVLQTKSKDCPICIVEINKDTSYCLTSCCHIMCETCAKIWFNDRTTCPLCRNAINIEEVQYISNQERQKYSTKICKLLELVKKEKEHGKSIVVYTQYDSLKTDLERILFDNGLTYCVFDNYTDIDTLRLEKRDVLIMNSIKNASGIDLSFVNNIVIFEPIIGTYNFLRDVERQIIGRLYRMNQKLIVNVHRLIIRDTIEEEIYKEIL